MIMGQWNLFGERFKCEKYYLHKYQTFEELALAMDEYIRFLIMKGIQKD
ncbi:hypothetical protein APP_05970 [Aeribacillus pallidus]|nr:hypothetical protein APP_05970 [Aeribacillus pallidus]